jgi:hypothetical protein
MKRTSGKHGRTYWHPAFLAAMQIELEEYSHDLEFIEEYQLTREPLKMDVLIIKKKADVTINHSVGKFFKEFNILEFKSRSDYISYSDFYKVVTYGMLYISLTKIVPSDLTLTFITSRYPRDVLSHLKKCGYKILNEQSGIYYIEGFHIAAQIINTKQMNSEDNLWLRSLGELRDKESAAEILSKCNENEKNHLYYMYLKTIAKVEQQIFEEVTLMSDKAFCKWILGLMERDGVLEEYEQGIMERGMQQGMQQGMQNMINKLKQFGMPDSDIERVLSLS